jgi:hypothetical protein
MIIDIEEELGNEDTSDVFAREARQWDRPQDNGDEDEADEAAEGAGDESFIGSEGQIFRNALMGQLLWYRQ